jgi:NADPH-dependent 2,4-dienoyl-CoA reductase/sulfur reductase-like enzyme
VECNRLACGYGLVPNVTLGEALGCALADDAIAVDELQRTSVHNVFAAGECTGIGGVELASLEGEIAGCVASGAAVPMALVDARRRWQAFAGRVQRAFALGAQARAWPSAETLLCRCEDVAFGAVAAHGNWREAKLHTRCGMGACQGRICGAAAQTYFGWSPTGGADVGARRPPFSPARISTLMAGASGDETRPIIELP